ncbi:MAG: glycosyl hydrolase 108 family protein [Pacificimonas sp.]|jgi:lysozyme family protein|nr:glycosyl hydrolase 108 family protein [Pacificimonas sp.]
MTQTIDRLLADLIAREGGYVDHPHDRGGPTRYGITQAVARKAGYTGPIRSLPLPTAKRIYRARYWSGPRFDAVAALYPRLAAELFDTGVNMGPGTAVSFLQRALNALNLRGRRWRDLIPTNRIDEATLIALRKYRAQRGPGGEDVLVRAVDALQGERYIALAEKRPANESFVHGWLSKRLGNTETANTEAKGGAA